MCKLEIYDESHLLEDLCNKINLKHAEKHGGKLLHSIPTEPLPITNGFTGTTETIQTIPTDMKNQWEIIELPMTISQALTDEEIYQFISLVFLQSLGRFEVMDNAPIFFGDIDGSGKKQLVYYAEPRYYDQKAKYLKLDQLEKEAFPKLRRLERKPLKKNKLG